MIKAIDIYQKIIYNMKQCNLCTESETEEHGMSYFLFSLIAEVVVFQISLLWEILLFSS